jgi:hypothetical protein
VLSRVREAVAYGHPVIVHDDGHLAVRATVGTYGVLYEIEAIGMWAYWRIRSITSGLVPDGAVMIPTAPCETSVMMHFWKEGAYRQPRKVETQVS